MTLVWMWQFIKLLLRDTRRQFGNTLRYLSAIKLVKLSVITFVTLSLFNFLSRLLVYKDFSVNWYGTGAAIFILAIFPILFVFEKFLSYYCKEKQTETDLFSLLFDQTRDVESHPPLSTSDENERKHFFAGCVFSGGSPSG